MFSSSAAALSAPSTADNDIAPIAGPVHGRDGDIYIIVANPGEFTAGQLSVAQQRVSAAAYGQPLADASFSFGEFAAEIGANIVHAGESVAAIGEGVMSAAAMARWLIPAAVLVAAGILLYRVAGAVPVNEYASAGSRCCNGRHRPGV